MLTTWYVASTRMLDLPGSGLGLEVRSDGTKAQRRRTVFSGTHCEVVVLCDELLCLVG